MDEKERKLRNWKRDRKKKVRKKEERRVEGEKG